MIAESVSTKWCPRDWQYQRSRCCWCCSRPCTRTALHLRTFHSSSFSSCLSGRHVSKFGQPYIVGMLIESGSPDESDQMATAPHAIDTVEASSNQKVGESEESDIIPTSLDSGSPMMSKIFARCPRVTARSACHHLQQALFT